MSSNFLNFNSLYQRVRIDAIQIKKQKPEPFQRRIQKFIKNTKQGAIYGECNANGRLRNYLKAQARQSQLKRIF